VKEGKESRRGGGLPWVSGKELERKGENLFGRKKRRGRRLLVICLSFFFFTAHDIHVIINKGYGLKWFCLIILFTISNFSIHKLTAG
jgi:hypothetical protein